MANIKSAKKRIKVNAKKAALNKARKSETKTFVKKVYSAIEEGNKETAAAALHMAEKKLAKAASKGVYKKNTMARKVSRLAKAVQKMA